MNLSELDYHLPRERIAQEPATRRDDARLLHLDRATGRMAHRIFRDLPSILGAEDVLVLNESAVIPARVDLTKPTGGAVEALFLRALGDGAWEALLRPSGRLAPGTVLRHGGVALVAEARTVPGRWRLRPAGEGAIEDLLVRAGRVPLPPYIRRQGDAGVARADRERYQTIYAARPGSVAAPTAGLHFTPALLAAVAARVAGVARVALHVGPGTFRPVTAARVEDHRMDPEAFTVPPEALAVMRRARAAGRRIVAAGTTSVRVLETLGANGLGGEGEVAGETALFITPGFRFRLTGAMLTNFHHPRSTPYCLVAALAGLDRIRRAYAEGLARGYRFLSYGDAMLIT